MPKTIKGSAGRKPPGPSARHSDIDDWLVRLTPGLQPIVKELDRSICPARTYRSVRKRAVGADKRTGGDLALGQADDGFCDAGVTRLGVWSKTRARPCR